MRIICVSYGRARISGCPGARGTEIFSRAPRFSRPVPGWHFKTLGHVYVCKYPGTRILGLAPRFFTRSCRMALAKNHQSSSPDMGIIIFGIIIFASSYSHHYICIIISSHHHNRIIMIASSCGVLIVYMW